MWLEWNRDSPGCRIPPEVTVLQLPHIWSDWSRQANGGPTATARWQLCSGAGGSILVPGVPIQVKAGYQPADGKGRLSGPNRAGWGPGQGSSTLRELESKWTWAEATLTGTGHLSAVGASVQPAGTYVTRASLRAPWPEASRADRSYPPLLLKMGSYVHRGRVVVDSRAGGLILQSSILTVARVADMLSSQADKHL